MRVRLRSPIEFRCSACCGEQVEDYTRRLPGVVREAVDDTAGAARMIAQNDWRYDIVVGISWMTLS